MEKEAKREQIEVSSKKVKTFLCATLENNHALRIVVESAFVRALPGFSIVGMAQQSIQESKDRIKSALTSIGYKFPAQKITVSMSPSDIKKEGSHFDLGIALLLYFQKESFTCRDFYVFGEIGLSGNIKSTTTLFPVILSLASQYESLNVMVPQDILKKVRQIPNVKAIGVATLADAIAYFQEEKEAIAEHLEYENALQIAGERYFFDYNFALDFADVKGQERLKRALVIAALGMHNILLEGSPGCGKSMSIKRLRYILPPMSMREMLESNAYNCLAGNDTDLSALRAFRSPHHSSSRPSIFGGGSAKAMAGECALAHNGVLFFDEFPHFSKGVLESLREPLEDNQILISRVNSKIKYDTKFLFAAAQNPCPCGNLLSQSKECRCNELEINRYKNRISEPLLERIDLYVQMSEQHEDTAIKSSKDMFADVLRGFEFQKNRGQLELNAKLSENDLTRISKLDTDAQRILEQATARFALSHRSIYKIQSIARTIADIAQSETITSEHVLEALSFRRR